MINKLRSLLLIFSFTLITCSVWAQNKILVLQSDFGIKDGAVSAMKGVASGVAPDLKIYDLTHEIPAYNIWEASYRLMQTVQYWPVGTVFVSVVDPGVGTARKSVVLKTKTGQFIVTPDNGTLTLIAETLGIEEVRQIDEFINRRKGSEKSYTFHGRDVYAFTGARLASGVINFSQVGPLLPPNIVRIHYQQPSFSHGTLEGNIPILDVQYGNIWTNINDSVFNLIRPEFAKMLHFTIYHNLKPIFEGDAPYSHSFGDVGKGKPLAYLNSLLQLSFALNQGDFAKTYHIGTGSDWSIKVTRK